MQDQINWIFSTLPKHKQTIALSATFPSSLAEYLNNYMLDPIHVRINPEDLALKGVTQYFCDVTSHRLPHKTFEEKQDVLIKILQRIPFHQCMIFSNYQSRAEQLCQELTKEGWPTTFIAGKQAQSVRLKAMDQLKKYTCRILVTTDLTARGIDCDKINLVINLDLPWDTETYLHRIGRAGRFGAHATAISIISHGKEADQLRDICADIKKDILHILEIHNRDGEKITLDLGPSFINQNKTMKWEELLLERRNKAKLESDAKMLLENTVKPIDTTMTLNEDTQTRVDTVAMTPDLISKSSDNFSSKPCDNIASKLSDNIALNSSDNIALKFSDNIALKDIIENQTVPTLSNGITEQITSENLNENVTKLVNDTTLPNEATENVTVIKNEANTLLRQTTIKDDTKNNNITLNNMDKEENDIDNPNIMNSTELNSKTISDCSSNSDVTSLLQEEAISSETSKEITSDILVENGIHLEKTDSPISVKKKVPKYLQLLRNKNSKNNVPQATQIPNETPVNAVSNELLQSLNVESSEIQFHKSTVSNEKQLPINTVSKEILPSTNASDHNITCPTMKDKTWNINNITTSNEIIKVVDECTVTFEVTMPVKNDIDMIRDIDDDTEFDNLREFSNDVIAPHDTEVKTVSCHSKNNDKSSASFEDTYSIKKENSSKKKSKQKNKHFDLMSVNLSLLNLSIKQPENAPSFLADTKTTPPSTNVETEDNQYNSAVSSINNAESPSRVLIFKRDNNNGTFDDVEEENCEESPINSDVSGDDRFINNGDNHVGDKPLTFLDNEYKPNICDEDIHSGGNRLIYSEEALSNRNKDVLTYPGVTTFTDETSLSEPNEYYSDNESTEYSFRKRNNNQTYKDRISYSSTEDSSSYEDSESDHSVEANHFHRTYSSESLSIRQDNFRDRDLFDKYWARAYRKHIEMMESYRRFYNSQYYMH